MKFVLLDLNIEVYMYEKPENFSSILMVLKIWILKVILSHPPVLKELHFQGPI